MDRFVDGASCESLSLLSLASVSVSLSFSVSLCLSVSVSLSLSLSLFLSRENITKSKHLLFWKKFYSEFSPLKALSRPARSALYIYVSDLYINYRGWQNVKPVAFSASRNVVVGCDSGDRGARPGPLGRRGAGPGLRHALPHRVQSPPRGRGPRGDGRRRHPPD